MTKIFRHCNMGLNNNSNLSMTLSKVLLALEKRFKNEYHKMIFQDGQLFFICAETPVCQFYWNLTKETIEEQSEETQRRINELLKN